MARYAHNDYGSRMTSSFSTMFSQWMSSGSKFVMEGVKNLVLGTKVRDRGPLNPLASFPGQFEKPEDPGNVATNPFKLK